MPNAPRWGAGLRHSGKPDCMASPYVGAFARDFAQRELCVGRHLAEAEMTRPTRIGLWLLGASAVSLALNLTGWRLLNCFNDTWSFMTDLGFSLSAGLVLLGSWPYPAWGLGHILLIDPSRCYVVGCLGWAALGIIIGILAEMRRAGRRLLIRPSSIILSFAVVFAAIEGFEAIVGLLVRRVPPGTAETMRDLSSFVGTAFVQIPALLAAMTLIHALVRHRDAEDAKPRAET